MPPLHRSLTKLRRDAEKIFHAGLKAVESMGAVKRHCRLENGFFHAGNRRYALSAIKRLFIVGAGKATAPMAAALEDLFGSRITGGVINVKYDHTVPLQYIKTIEAGHPVPDQNGAHGARRMLEMVEDAGADDLIICLISGGGSALMPLPDRGLTLQDKQESIKTLMACGASIHEINTIRKHTSAIKGGRLARAASPAALIAFILSDVVGDDLDIIASGPTVPDDSTFQDCMSILEKYGIHRRLPEAVVRHFESGLIDKNAESPKPGDPVFADNQNIIIGSNMEAIQAARKEAEARGYPTIVLSSMIEGETRDVAGVHTAIVREVAKSGNPVSPPVCILSGGETTVTLRGRGKGGGIRNSCWRRPCKLAA